MITSIKLEEKSIELNGKTYVLHVNMSVLERIQEEVGGDLQELIKSTPTDAMAVTMAAMLNDWAEDQGWDEVWTVKKVKKTFTTGMLNMLDVAGMFFRAMIPTDQKTEDTKPDTESGN